MPLVSFLGPAVVGVITGSIVIETIFGLPGIGRAFVDGALNRDYTLVLGVTILYGVLIVFFNLLADLSYSVARSQGALLMAAATDALNISSAPAGRSLWQDAFARLMHDRIAVASGIVLGVIVLASIVVPWISPYNYYTPQWAASRCAAYACTAATSSEPMTSAAICWSA